MQVAPPGSAPVTRQHSLAMADGCRLAVVDSAPEAPRASVLIVHGLGEHSGRHEALARWFHARGYAVRRYDQRGHGRSEGPRGGLETSDDLVDDLAVVFNDFAEQQDNPPLLLGHSMGGLVAARCVLDRQVGASALILSSPALRCHEPAWLQRLAGSLAKIAPRLPLDNGLKLDKLSHDVRVATAYKADPLCHRRITPRLADFIFRTGHTTVADGRDLAIPTLLLVAGSDDLVNPAGSRDFAAAAWSTQKLTTRFFDTLYHELFNEAEPARTQVFKQLGDWLARL